MYAIRSYYALGVEGQTKGCVHLLFPASMLKLDSARSAGTKIDAGSKSAGAADDLCAPVDILVVITSYSIHYTKLYDRFAEEFAESFLGFTDTAGIGLLQGKRAGRLNGNSYNFV